MLFSPLDQYQKSICWNWNRKIWYFICNPSIYLRPDALVSEMNYCENHSIFHWLNILTTEKEELVNLVLIHANSISDSNSNRSSSQFSEDNFSNPFDQIKQTCQNLFTSFTDKIASGERLHFDIVHDLPLSVHFLIVFVVHYLLLCEYCTL